MDSDEGPNPDPLGDSPASPDSATRMWESLRRQGLHESARTVRFNMSSSDEQRAAALSAYLENRLGQPVHCRSRGFRDALSETWLITGATAPQLWTQAQMLDLFALLTTAAVLHDADVNGVST